MQTRPSLNTINTTVTAIITIISCLFIIALDIALFPKFAKINYFNMWLEFLLAMFALVPLFAIQKYKANSFYFNLNIGFYLLFLSYFVDAIDQIFIHSIIFTVIMEKVTLVIAAIFIYIGSRQWMRSFEALSLTDYLTKIPNRRLISKIADSEIAKCVSGESVLSIAIIDIDFFKNINDEFGHNAGDEILKSFAKFLKNSLGDNFELGRWGGEEFIVLMRNTDIDHAKTIMNKLRLKVEKEKIEQKEYHHALTVSIGLSQWHDDSDDFESLFIKADKALYRAKKTGRNKVEF